MFSGYFTAMNYIYLNFSWCTYVGIRTYPGILPTSDGIRFTTNNDLRTEGCRLYERLLQKLLVDVAVIDRLTVSIVETTFAFGLWCGWVFGIKLGKAEMYDAFRQRFEIFAEFTNHIDSRRFITANK